MFARQAKSHGMTLVELVLAIALAGVMIAGLMSAYSSIVGRSADPMIRAQATALAESFLEEVSLKSFLDPVTGVRCPAPESSRSNFNNVCDYNGYSATGIALPNGATIAGLELYSVAITVADIASSELGSIPTHCALKITVSITNPINEITVMFGYRTNYEAPCS